MMRLLFIHSTKNKSNNGQSIVEYILIHAFVALVIVFSLTLFGGRLSVMISNLLK
jgi:Flp pilus assembly pilin Flp